MRYKLLDAQGNVLYLKSAPKIKKKPWGYRVRFKLFNEPLTRVTYLASHVKWQSHQVTIHLLPR